MDKCIDSVPFTIIGLNKAILKKVNVELAQIFKNFNNFIAKVIDSNKGQNSQENSIVQLLLDPKNHFSNQEIYEELILTTMASFATSTKTLAATLVLLAMHKDKQQKLFDEIDEIYSTESDTKFSNDFLQKFIYLDAVLKESMRIFPAIPIIGREASEEVEIEGYLIPKGTVILISIFAMHRDKKIWGDDADAFKPERFFEELTNPHAFVPFAGGKRICIGYRYAMVSMKIFLINFLRKYKVDCLTKFEEIETEMTLTLNFVNGFNVSIEKRGNEKNFIC
ncbi:hypothetical protein ACKWTF_016245 [Chironomus riparius]